MKTFVLLFLCCLPVAAQKMHVKVLGRKSAGTTFTQYVPGFGLNNRAGSANCAAYGNTANCAANSTGTSIYAPAHEVQGYMSFTGLLLALSDGRAVEVSCADHFGSFNRNKFHVCKKPEVPEFEAEFSGAKVKLIWAVGIDGKTKESEEYQVGKVYAAGEKLPIVVPPPATDSPKP